jgi:drug/metabolite transporter (DMT)-like permease
MWFQCIALLLIFGLTPLLNKEILNHISTEGFIFVQILVAFVFIIVFFSFFFHHKIKSDLVIFKDKPHLYGYVITSTLLVFVVADYFYLHVLKHYNPSIVVPIVACYPLITILYSFLFMKEPLGALHFIGSGFVVTGLVLLNQ